MTDTELYWSAHFAVALLLTLLWRLAKWIVGPPWDQNG